jgi:hypothetical protein
MCETIRVILEKQIFVKKEGSSGILYNFFLNESDLKVELSSHLVHEGPKLLLIVGASQ